MYFDINDFEIINPLPKAILKQKLTVSTTANNDIDISISLDRGQVVEYYLEKNGVYTAMPVMAPFNFTLSIPQTSFGQLFYKIDLTTIPDDLYYATYDEASVELELGNIIWIHDLIQNLILKGVVDFNDESDSYFLRMVVGAVPDYTVVPVNSNYLLSDYGEKWVALRERNDCDI